MYYLLMWLQTTEFVANSEDPDQMQRSAVLEKSLVVAFRRRVFEPHSAQWYFIYLLYTLFSEVLALAKILGRNSLLKFV